MSDEQAGGARVVRWIRLAAFTIVMLALLQWQGALHALPILDVAPFDDPVANAMLRQQLLTLPVALLALAITFLFATRVRLSYLRPRLRGPLKPLFPGDPGGRWETDGWVLGLIMTAIVGVVTFFQFLPNGFAFTLTGLLLVVPFSALNAFNEEVLYRLPFVTMGANDTGSRVYGLVFGSLVFGVSHYWGVAPNGVVGAIMAAITGYILAKSIQETRGFLWAFAIHLMLDVPIFVWLLSQPT